MKKWMWPLLMLFSLAIATYLVVSKKDTPANSEEESPLVEKQNNEKETFSVEEEPTDSNLKSKAGSGLLDEEHFKNDSTSNPNPKAPTDGANNFYPNPPPANSGAYGNSPSEQNDSFMPPPPPGYIPPTNVPSYPDSYAPGFEGESPPPGFGEPLNPDEDFPPPSFSNPEGGGGPINPPGFGTDYED